MARRCAMNPGDLLLHLEAYLALENALGFSLRARERLLRDFVAFVEANNTTGPISSQIALECACSVSARCAAISASPQRDGPRYRSAQCVTAGSTAAIKAVSLLHRGDQLSTKRCFVNWSPSIAATAHPFNVIGVAG